MQLTSPYLLVRVGEPIIVGLLIKKLKKKMKNTGCIQLSARMNGLTRRDTVGFAEKKASRTFTSCLLTTQMLAFFSASSTYSPLSLFLFPPLTSALLERVRVGESQRGGKNAFLGRDGETAGGKTQTGTLTDCTDATDELWRTSRTQRCHTLVF